MSQLDDLIAEHCTDGVRFRALGDLIQYEQPTKFLVSNTDYSDNYETPVLTAGQTFILGYTDESHGIYPATKSEPVIIFDDFTTAFKWVDFPFKAKSSAMKMLRPKSVDEIILRFAFYVMQTIRYQPQNHARQWIGTYSKFRIPVPPLEVQREIVRILDTFTALEAELEAELEARQIQYEYYRDSFLTFGPETRRETIGDIGELVRGNGMPKSDFSESGVGAIHYGQIYTHFGTFTDSVISHVPAEKASRLAKVDNGDLIITNTSENLPDVGKAVAWLGDEQIVTGGHATVLKHQQNTKFLAYWFQTPDFHSQKRRFATGTKVIDVPAKALAKITLPLPSLEEQGRIVSILDHFEALTNDFAIGLPAEIEARRKQYEHYRDKLLTFKELPS